MAYGPAFTAPCPPDQFLRCRSFDIPYRRALVSKSPHPLTLESITLLDRRSAALT